ncbi:MAG: hypothetical protein Q7S81_00410 [bacterium]|nr:hypothetical protein [bacterium]
MTLAIILLVMGLLAAIFAGVSIEKGDDCAPVPYFILAIACILIGSAMVYRDGVGKLKLVDTDFERNAIYETMSSVLVNPDNAGSMKYAVVIRGPGGHLVAYLLDNNPPKKFAVLDGYYLSVPPK